MAEAAGGARAVVFDLDEVLVAVQTPARWQWAWKPNGPPLAERHVRASIHRELHAWDRRRWRGLVGAEPPVGPAEYAEHLRRTLLAVADRPLPEQEIEAVLDRFLRPAGPFEPFEDGAPSLAALAARSVPYAVLTPMPDDAALGLLKRAGLPEDRLVPSSGGQSPPPDRSAFRRAAAQLGVKPSSTFYVGDLYWSDVRAAARAGLSALLLDRSGRAGQATGVRIRTLAELPGHLEGTAAAPASPAPLSPPPQGGSDGTAVDSQGPEGAE